MKVSSWELPRAYAGRVATEKAQALANKYKGIILSGDTVVACESVFFKKQKMWILRTHVYVYRRGVNIVSMVALL